MKKNRSLGLLLVVGLLPEVAIAQIVPDATLPTPSQVRADNNTVVIEGGTVRGRNLFHSFEQFSVLTGTGAAFNNSLEIENIFSRVTGQRISELDGVIRAAGTANLFLLNPNGILFGPNAALDLQGSFVGSTATRIDFADGQSFSASPSSSTPPLLTVSAPVGLGFSANPGRIINRSGAIASETGTTAPTGLRVRPGQTLALVGGEILLDGGHLTAPGGRIELGSVAAESKVRLLSTEAGYALTYPEITGLDDIHLTNLAKVDASGPGGGAVAVRGNNILLTKGAKITSNTTGAIPGKNVTITAANSVQVLGTTDKPGLFEPSSAAFGILVPLRSQINTSTFGEGDAGAITIDARQLILQDGAQITSSAITTPGTTTVGDVAGRGGDVTVNVADLVDIAGVVEVGGTGSNPISLPGLERFFFEVNGASNLSTISAGSGDAGNITINTDKLRVRQGGVITANPFLAGRGGSLRINAADWVEVKGTSPSGVVNSGIVTTALGSGNAGDITIDTGKLIIQDGALVSAQATRSGQGGNLVVRAADSVEVRGRSARSFSRLQADALGSGSAGNLRIETGQFTVSDGAQVSVSGSSTGSAGNLIVQADNLRLDQGILTAATAVGDRGNITLQVQNLELRHNSRIQTDATNTANGGNINIDAEFIVAVPEENSDISANAVVGQGGNIQITTQSIFGLQFRDRPTSHSDITASSEFGVDGIVQINTPDADPSRGLTTLPIQFTDVSGLLARDCTGRSGRVARKSSQIQLSEFYVVGRGGIPPAPGELLVNEAVLADWVTLDQSARAGGDANLDSVEPQAWAETPPTQASQQDTTQPDPHPPAVEEARGWVIGPDGNVILTAQPVTTTSPSPWSSPTACLDAWKATNAVESDQILISKKTLPNQ